MAVPNPERELKRLTSAVRAGLPRVVLVMGASDFFRSQAMDLLVAGVPGDAEVRSIAGNEETSGAELQDLRGASLFGAGAWIVVRRGADWLKAHGETLLDVVPVMRDGCGLVVETVKLDKRTKLAKALLAAGEVFEFRDLYKEPYDRTRSPTEGELVGWIVQRARGLGVSMSPDAALMLVSTVGTDPAELLGVAEGLKAQVGDRRGPLSPADLRGLLPSRFQSSQFELAEAVLAGDRVAAERSLVALFGRGMRARDGATIDRGGLFPMITSWLWTSFTNAYEGRRQLDSGVPLRELPRRMGVRAFQDRFMSEVQRNDEARLRRGLQLLVEIQRELRLTGEDPEWLLERFLQRYFAEATAGAAS